MHFYRRFVMSEKIARFLADTALATPCLVVDLDVVAEQYEKLKRFLPLADVFYAVKANPAPEIIGRLIALGCGFDVASRSEIALCLELGADPARLSYGNTIKKEADIAWAYERGVRMFAFDAAGELEKLARAAPGAEVYCRILVDNSGAEWPLSRKFGCDLPMARDLMVTARDLGLDPAGAAFHVGSQQTDPSRWGQAVADAGHLFRELAREGITLRVVNVGGGLPARYRDVVADADAYADAVMHAMTTEFGNHLPAIIIEPGRYLVGDAGVLLSEVVLISRKSYGDFNRWVYLDVGRFSGLAETEGEAIKYRLRTPRDGDTAETGPVVLAGPTCDSADMLYENAGYEMPLALAVGDRVQILAAGAYTTAYASAFNGAEPIRTHFI